MPFDPNIPTPGTETDALQMRAQFQALHDEIIAAAVTGAGVDAVNTVTPGTPAAASAALVAGEVRFSFDIPQGQTGEVSAADLSAAVQGTAQNPVGIAPLNPDAALADVIEKVNALLGALQRL